MKRNRIKKPGNRWVPKKWRPEYEVIVLLSSTGMSHQAISDEIFAMSGTRYTVQHISNILNVPEAVRLQQESIERLREDHRSATTTRVEKLHDKALGRIEDMIDSDEYFTRAPFAVVDRCMAFMKMTKSSAGIVKDDPPAVGGGGTFIQNAMVMTKEAAEVLAEGTRKADEVARLYGAVGEPAA